MPRPSELVIRAGELRHMVTVEGPTRINDPGGGYTETFVPLPPSPVPGAVEPATAVALERVVANAVQSSATHIVTIRFHPLVTLESRVSFTDRAGRVHLLTVKGMQNPEQRDRVLKLACEEVV